MQIAYSAVAAGNGSNPKAPPPTSDLLRQYLCLALSMQDMIDKFQDVPQNEYLAWIIRQRCQKLLWIYNQMCDVEREIVEGSHIPPKTACAIQSLINDVMNGRFYDLMGLGSLATDLSDILYISNTIGTPCTLH